MSSAATTIRLQDHVRRSRRFDYNETVFGDELVVDLSERRWGAIRMRRCLAALGDVTGRVLEVGCGAGRCIRTVHRYRPDLECYGCDIAQPSIALARDHHDPIQYETADAAALPYPDEHFDALIVLDLIEHVDDVSAVLREFRRVLKPGGRLFLHVPCEGMWLSIYRPLLGLGIDLTRDAVGHLHHFRRSHARGFVRQAGFAIRRQEYSMYWIGQFHDVVNWLTMLRRRASNGETSARPTNPPPIPTKRRARLLSTVKRIVTRRLWWGLSRLVPAMQYWETRLLSWQPVGSIGLCLTCDRRE